MILRLSLVFFCSLVTHAQVLTPNDVTVLLPLPRVESELGLLRPSTEGGKGALIPHSILERVGTLDQHEYAEDTLKKLVVVALRFDPCFEIEKKCVPQIRLVLQPLTRLWGKISTQDATVHAFYNLSEQEFGKLLAGLRDIKKSFPGVSGPLQIHPLLKEQGYQGPFAKAFFPLVLSFIGEQNLSRLTFMQLFVGSDKWGFGGYDVVNGEVRPLQIPRVGSEFQTFRVATVNGKNFNLGDTVPEPQGEDTLGELVKNSNNFRDEGELKAKAIAIRRMENPKVHSPATLDCVSCHLTQTAASIVFDAKADLSSDAEVKRWTYPSPFENLSMRKRDVRVLRSLGYFESDPVTNTRVVNETAAILEYLNK